VETIAEVLPMIVSICQRESGWWEVWLSLPVRESSPELPADAEVEAEELVSRMLLRTRDIEAAVDLVAGVLATWR
jgi:hypothetical protein